MRNEVVMVVVVVREEVQCIQLYKSSGTSISLGSYHMFPRGANIS